MTSSEIIKRARALSDLTNADFITYEDEVSSLWETWKDIYSKITDSSDDYFLSTVTIDVLGSSTQIGENEWELDIPDNIYKLRYVNYYQNGRWLSMNKFNTLQRNKQLSAPHYRWRGDKLWIVASSLPQQIRIDFYPPPIKPNLPEMNYIYGSSYAEYDKVNISSPTFTKVKDSNMTEDIDYLFYVYNDDIIVESLVLQSKTTLYSSGTSPTNLVYNLGWLYWIDLGDIYRASTNFSSTLVPVQLTTSGSISNFSISKGLIYWTDDTNTNSMKLDGTDVTLVYAYSVTDLYYIGTDKYYLDTTIFKNDVDLNISAEKMTSDGKYIYYLDSAGVLHKYLDSDIILYLNVQEIGTSNLNFIGAINDELLLQALSTIEDTEFVYPINEANEIMAYQSAIDYKRKQSADTTDLTTRLLVIWDRFMDVLKRDEYQPERRSSEVPQWYY